MNCSVERVQNPSEKKMGVQPCMPTVPLHGIPTADKRLQQGNLGENRKKGNERQRVGIKQLGRLATERNQWHSPDDTSYAKTHKED